MIVLGIALMGMFPLVIAHSRGMQSLERRYAESREWYLAPSADAWARKLGARATLVRDDPGALSAPPVLIVDDGDSGYGNTGGAWTQETNPLTYLGFYHWHPPLPPETPRPDPPDPAVWTFASVTPGWYYIEAAWIDALEQAYDAHYTFYDNDLLLSELSVNQQLAPAGPNHDGRTWQVLATEYIGSGVARVQLDGLASGNVIADAVRLVPVENDVQVASFERSPVEETATADVPSTLPRRENSHDTR